jgi:hypothetical protein
MRAERTDRSPSTPPPTHVQAQPQHTSLGPCWAVANEICRADILDQDLRHDKRVPAAPQGAKHKSHGPVAGCYTARRWSNPSALTGGELFRRVAVSERLPCGLTGASPRPQSNARSDPGCFHLVGGASARIEAGAISGVSQDRGRGGAACRDCLMFGPSAAGNFCWTTAPIPDRPP